MAATETAPPEAAKAAEANIVEPTSSKDATLNEPEPFSLDNYERPQGLQFALITLGLALAIFIISLDSTIVAPAIPAISNDFNSLADVTWYLSIYLATSTAFQPLAGTFYKFSVKWTFLAFIVIFEIGSLICAVAPSSPVFILGRAIAGIGLAGGYVGVMTCIAIICPIEERAKWANNVGGVYSLGAVSGPLIGGAFTTHSTWRWCFWINLPLGGVTILACLLFLREPPRQGTGSMGKRFLETCKNVDIVGLTLIMGALVMLLMTFQWGGLEYAWNDSIIIGLLVGFGVTVIAIVAWFIYHGEKAMLPPRLLKKRGIAGGALCNFAIGGAYFNIISFLAIYYQVRGSSSIRSGVQLLPLIAGVVSALILGGVLAPVVGYAPPFIYAGLAILCISSGVLTLLDENTSTPMWAGITFMTGFGSGTCWQFPYVAAQTILAPEDLEIGSMVVIFSQTLGGAIIFGLGQSLYQNYFYTHVRDIANLPNADTVAKSGVTAFRELAPPEFVEQITRIGVDSVKLTYYAPIVLTGLALLAVPLIPWNSIRPPTAEATTAKTIEEGEAKNEKVEA